MFNFFSKSSAAEKLWFETDIHCHILPGIDDGSPSVERSMQLLERMEGWGLKRILASPHVTYGTFENDPETIQAARNSLQSALDEAGSNLVLGNSAEYRIDELFESHRAAGKLLTLPGDRLLIENSFLQEPPGLDKLVFDLQVEGFRPILVHPERYAYYHSGPDRYRALHDLGLRFQINVLSLTGYYGKDERRMAEWLMNNDLVDYVGTDLHSLRHADSIDEYLRSRTARQDRKILGDKIKNDAI